MKFSYRFLSDFVADLPTPKDLGELLTLHTLQVEGIEKHGGDMVLDIDVLSFRMPDAASHLGIAREAAAILGRTLKIPRSKIPKASKLNPKVLRVVDTTKGAVPAYFGVLLDQVTLATSPSWVRERLEACGIRPINNVVDVTNYVMLESGQPLHAFDYDKITGRELTIRYSKKGEHMATLDEVTRELPEGAIVLEDKERITDLAGIMGGAASAIDTKTRSVYLHSAIFDRTRIRKAEAATKHRTEASKRYAYGVDPEGAEAALWRAVELLREWGAARLRVVGMVALPQRKRIRVRIAVRLSYAERLLGAPVNVSKSIQSLLRLGCKVTKKGKEGLIVEPPSWRPDLTTEEDIIEEIGRMMGYHNVKAEPPLAHLDHPEANVEVDLADNIRDFLASQGYREVETYALEPRRTFLEAERRDMRLALANPLSEEFAYMRDTLARGLVRMVSENITRMRALKFFEVGHVFRVGSHMPDEVIHIAGIAVADKKPDLAYFEAKGMMELLLRRFGIADIGFEDYNGFEPQWPFTSKAAAHPYRSAVCKSGGEVLGTLYQLHPDVFPEAPCVVFEVSFSQLLAKVEYALKFEAIPRFPAIVRDVAVLVPKDIRAQQVEDVIVEAGGTLLADTELFDYYEGDAIGEDQKSLAFHLIFQSHERTLEDREVSRVFDKITEALRAEGWELRA